MGQPYGFELLQLKKTKQTQQRANREKSRGNQVQVSKSFMSWRITQNGLASPCSSNICKGIHYRASASFYIEDFMYIPFA